MRVPLILASLVLLAACQRDADPAATPPAAAAPAATGAQDGGTEAAGNGVVDATAEVPTFTGTATDGTPYDLAAHRGRWVVVNFWATWCGPCIKEMPELSALHTMRQNVEVVGLAYEDIEPADMQAFLEERPVSYPVVVLDPMRPPQDFATPRGLPTTYLIAPDGKVARHFLGPVTAQDIEQAIVDGGGKVG
ncbi:TlpA disulfide reductase family protein [Xanthomonas sp. XNM01]|uniref:TlpA family protein disulfide reductase n=1 Tax=Xanthomonas sp. XNM01 TaxID=2769289 RepID=UPI001784EE3E|nr:TlpA disulfide reductase family protein [Xanthomonas sp. XNM01]MBD9369360.1 TlpA family protein disulfide reductase [Xanthomonas sp. XNM01]